MLARSDPGRSAELLDLAQQDIDERWHYYEQLAGLERALPEPRREVFDDAVEEASADAVDEGDLDA
jgi:hypothetical protein